MTTTCEHTRIEWGDDDERGVCKNCGAECDWHYETEVFDNYPEYVAESKGRIVDNWYKPEELAN